MDVVLDGMWYLNEKQNQNEEIELSVSKMNEEIKTNENEILRLVENDLFEDAEIL